MKMRLAIVVVVVLLMLTACGESTAMSNGQGQMKNQADNYSEEFAALSKEKENLDKNLGDAEKEYQKLQGEYDSLKAEYGKMSDDYKKLQAEYSAYKEKMQEYEQLQADEIEARRIAAAKILAEEQERKRKEEEEAARKKEEEEKRGYDTGITYKQLARTPDDYKNQKVKFTGIVAQVMDGDEEIHIRLAVNGSYDTILYCAYEPALLDFRILEDDQITIYGESLGLYSYQSTGAGTITIPCVWVDKIELKSSK